METAEHRLSSKPADVLERTGDRVAILLCTRGGARFLGAQLESLIDQSHTNWRVYASDDGSNDETVAVLCEYQARMARGVLNVRNGPRQGFVLNFLSLSCACDIEGDYFAFCDQDDVWEPDKLARALAWLAQIDPRVPALYCSRTHLIDEQGKCVGLSPLHLRTPHFRNALVQCIAGGNTMVFNAAARRLLMKAGTDVNVPSHDWWLYLLVTAMAGAVWYDHRPSVRYRVHSANTVGANSSLRGHLARLVRVLKGRLRTWTDMHVAALLQLSADITPECRTVLGEFVEVRRGSIFWRAWRMHCTKVYRQTLAGNIALYIALVLRRA